MPKIKTELAIDDLKQYGIEIHQVKNAIVHLTNHYTGVKNTYNNKRFFYYIDQHNEKFPIFDMQSIIDWNECVIETKKYLDQFVNDNLTYSFRLCSNEFCYSCIVMTLNNVQIRIDDGSSIEMKRAIRYAIGRETEEDIIYSMQKDISDRFGFYVVPQAARNLSNKTKIGLMKRLEETLERYMQLM